MEKAKEFDPLAVTESEFLEIVKAPHSTKEEADEKIGYCLRVIEFLSFNLKETKDILDSVVLQRDSLHKELESVSDK